MNDQPEQTKPSLQIGIEAIKMDDGYEVAVKRLQELAENGDPQSLMLYVQLRQLVNLELGLKQVADSFNFFAASFARMQKISEEKMREAGNPEHMVKQFASTINAIKELGGLNLNGLFGETKKG